MLTRSILGAERDAHTPRHHHLDKIFSFSFLVATIFLYPVAVVSRTNPKICHLSIRFEPPTTKSESILISNTPHTNNMMMTISSHILPSILSTRPSSHSPSQISNAHKGSSHKRSWSDASNNCREEVSTFGSRGENGISPKKKVKSDASSCKNITSKDTFGMEAMKRVPGEEAREQESHQLPEGANTSDDSSMSPIPFEVDSDAQLLGDEICILNFFLS